MCLLTKQSYWWIPIRSSYQKSNVFTFQPRQDTLVVHILVSHSQVHLNETGNEAGAYTGWDFCTVTIYITGSILLDAALCNTGGQW